LPCVVVAKGARVTSMFAATAGATAPVPSGATAPLHPSATEEAVKRAKIAVTGIERFMSTS
jgi:hypothetical protein